MIYRALTTLSVSDGGRRIIISSFRHRSILAALLLWMNRPVPISRLVSMIWEDAAPRTARQQVQNCVSALRGLLCREGLPSEIMCDANGYVLIADDRDADVTVFRWLTRAARRDVAAGDIASAVSSLNTALDLWSGTPCEELQVAVAGGDVAALAEERLQALELLGTILMERGDHERICLALCDIEHTYPYNERLAAMRAIALHRSGRSGEAVVALRTMRERLRTELGVASGAELARAEQELLVPC